MDSMRYIAKARNGDLVNEMRFDKARKRQRASDIMVTR